MHEPLMSTEIRQTAQVIRQQQAGNTAVIKALVHRLQQRPVFVATIARGSSDHACTVLKYAFETTLGWPTMSLSPSVVTMYHTELNLRDALVIAVSQSGSSPDVVETLRMARQQGALTVAVVNVEGSALANEAEFVLSIHAGEERAVAATKSFSGSLTAVYGLLAHLTSDDRLHAALSRLPDLLDGLGEIEAVSAVRAERFRFADHLLILSRGLQLGIAQEAALKLKEMCGLHAEAFSIAEFRHGPMQLLAEGYPLFGFTSSDPAGLTTLEAGLRFASTGSDVTFLGSGPKANDHHLSVPETGHPLTDPIANITAFYAFAVALAQLRGLNPDSPALLSKVTKTR